MQLFILYVFVCVIYSLIKGINYLDRELKFNIVDYVLLLSIPMTAIFLIYVSAYEKDKHKNHYTKY